jgi:hypothetical protein
VCVTREWISDPLDFGHGPPVYAVIQLIDMREAYGEKDWDGRWEIEVSLVDISDVTREEMDRWNIQNYGHPIGYTIHAEDIAGWAFEHGDRKDLRWGSGGESPFVLLHDAVAWANQYWGPHLALEAAA